MEVVQFELEERKVEKISPVNELDERDAIDLHNSKLNMEDIKKIKTGHRRLKV